MDFVLRRTELPFCYNFDLIRFREIQIANIQAFQS